MVHELSLDSLGDARKAESISRIWWRLGSEVCGLVKANECNEISRKYVRKIRCTAHMHIDKTGLRKGRLERSNLEPAAMPQWGKLLRQDFHGMGTRSLAVPSWNKHGQTPLLPTLGSRFSIRCQQGLTPSNRGVRHSATVGDAVTQRAKITTGPRSLATCPPEFREKVDRIVATGKGEGATSGLAPARLPVDTTATHIQCFFDSLIRHLRSASFDKQNGETGWRNEVRDMMDATAGFRSQIQPDKHETRVESGRATPSAVGTRIDTTSTGDVDRNLDEYGSDCNGRTKCGAQMYWALTAMDQDNRTRPLFMEGLETFVAEYALGSDADVV
ncbi:hypothetical protein FISHEDRAFT_61598 [Fistulina hepatica ATCC 64428]|uniref:Uncharacterized protein n=1 Tax=Fistulina hepatica ATCC 64428 TaxID=1128425 RepID=A0A0D7A1N3_9AGAR|nr:hypothetical protein FISHEDRAFT_61598 [Fistulina hepatica ATCC 64428]